MKEMQLRALNRWEFEECGKDEYSIRIDNLFIQWNVQCQFGAYLIDGSLELIHNWDELDELIQQTAIY